jgi:hypothetical protein
MIALTIRPECPKTVRLGCLNKTTTNKGLVLSNLSTEPKSPISDESIIVKQYKVLIDKLIPLQQKNSPLQKN